MGTNAALVVGIASLLIDTGYVSGQEAHSAGHDIRMITVSPSVQLEVLDWGGIGPPLVFLAGESMNAHVFDHLAPRFTETHHVLGVTRRGHGASSWPDSGYDTSTRVHDLLVVVDSLGLDEIIFAGHSLAGEEMTRFASDYPDRVLGLIYIDAGHDPTLIDHLRLGEVCPFSQPMVEEIEQRFHNLEDFHRTQRRNGAPWVAETAPQAETPDYTAVRAPALGIYHVPKEIGDLFYGHATPSAQCVSAFQHYIYEGIGQFAAEMREAKIVTIQDTQHNIHLVSPEELEAIMKVWLENLNRRN